MEILRNHFPLKCDNFYQISGKYEMNIKNAKYRIVDGQAIGACEIDVYDMIVIINTFLL